MCFFDWYKLPVTYVPEATHAYVTVQPFGLVPVTCTDTVPEATHVLSPMLVPFSFLDRSPITCVPDTRAYVTVQIFGPVPPEAAHVGSLVRGSEPATIPETHSLV